MLRRRGPRARAGACSARVAVHHGPPRRRARPVARLGGARPRPDHPRGSVSVLASRPARRVAGPPPARVRRPRVRVCGLVAARQVCARVSRGGAPRQQAVAPAPPPDAYASRPPGSAGGDRAPARDASASAAALHPAGSRPVSAPGGDRPRPTGARWTTGDRSGRFPRTPPNSHAGSGGSGGLTPPGRAGGVTDSRTARTRRQRIDPRRDGGRGRTTHSSRIATSDRPGTCPPRKAKSNAPQSGRSSARPGWARSARRWRGWATPT